MIGKKMKKIKHLLAIILITSPVFVCSTQKKYDNYNPIEYKKTSMEHIQENCKLLHSIFAREFKMMKMTYALMYYSFKRCLHRKKD